MYQQLKNTSPIAKSLYGTGRGVTELYNRKCCLKNKKKKGGKKRQEEKLHRPITSLPYEQTTAS